MQVKPKMKPSWLPSSSSVKIRVKTQIETQDDYQVKPRPKRSNDVQVMARSKSKSKSTSTHKSNIKNDSQVNSRLKARGDFQVNALLKPGRLPSQSQSRANESQNSLGKAWLKGPKPRSKPKTQVKACLDFGRRGFPINRSPPPLFQRLENPSLRERIRRVCIHRDCNPIESIKIQSL